VLAASAVLILQAIFLNLPSAAAIVFCGDGGAIVLDTILMAMFYAPRESGLCKSWPALSLWKAASYAISTRLSFLTIGRLIEPSASSFERMITSHLTRANGGLGAS
jgi:hypothetical protein